MFFSLYNEKLGYEKKQNSLFQNDLFFFVVVVKKQKHEILKTNKDLQVPFHTRKENP